MFPLLLDDGKPVIETSIIIEHLQAHHPGPNRWIPDGDDGRRVRFLDRFFDLYVMDNMQVAVANALRPEGTQRSLMADEARQRAAAHRLRLARGEPRRRPWAVGDAVHAGRLRRRAVAILRRLGRGDRAEAPAAAAYRARLLAHPVVARAVDEGRPYRAYFPLGAPDRD